MAEVYDTTRFGELYYASRSPALVNLGLAAKYMTEVLTRYQIPFAIMGGWAMYLRGGGRQTQDVDIAVTVQMNYLKQILLSDPRICFPATHGQTSVQIFVRTGPSYDRDFMGSSDLAISIDVVIGGNLGTPIDLRTACENIRPATSTPLGTSAVVLGLPSQLHAKLSAFVDRGATSNNDFQDLVFLLNTYGAQIPQIRDYLKTEHREAFVQKYASTYVGYDAAITNVRQLLGV